MNFAISPMAPAAGQETSSAEGDPKESTRSFFR
jgi:hypothetical protein